MVVLPTEGYVTIIPGW